MLKIYMEKGHQLHQLIARRWKFLVRIDAYFIILFMSKANQCIVMDGSDRMLPSRVTEITILLF